MAKYQESEAQTRRKRIDPKLAAQGWTVADFAAEAQLSVLESRPADANTKVERTTQAVLAKAFRGEL